MDHSQLEIFLLTTNIPCQHVDFRNIFVLFLISIFEKFFIRSIFLHLEFSKCSNLVVIFYELEYLIKTNVKNQLVYFSLYAALIDEFSVNPTGNEY